MVFSSNESAATLLVNETDKAIELMLVFMFKANVLKNDSRYVSR